MIQFSRRHLGRRLISIWDATSLALQEVWESIVSQLPAKRVRRVPLPPARVVGPSLQLPLHPVRQLTSFSCTASVLQSLYLYYSGRRLSHLEAIRLMGCRPDGAPLGKIATVAKRRLRCSSQQIRTAAQIRQSLKSGSPVIASDEEGYESSHAILVTGFTRKGFWLIDSAVGRARWRSQKRLLRTSDEFISVSSGRS